MDVNKANKGDLLSAIKDKFKGREFTHKQSLKLLPGFNHSKKIWALLEALVKDGKLSKTDKGYKVMKEESVESFVRRLCEGRSLPVTKTRLEIIVTEAVGYSITNSNKAKALKVLNQAVSVKSAVTAAVGKKCPRCNTPMASVTLSDKRKAYYCENDRVTLPR